MTTPIENYALISDCHTGALVGANGSIDWLCLPRYDSPAMFAALLGTEDNGRWLIAPNDDAASVRREYVGDSFVLRSVWTTPTGTVEVIDAMPVQDRRADIIRRIRGIKGTVEMRQELEIRFGYGDVVPWVRRLDHTPDLSAEPPAEEADQPTSRRRDSVSSGPSVPSHPYSVDDPDDRKALVAVAGPDAVKLRGPHLPSATDMRHEGTFQVAEGETLDYVMTWFPSHRKPPGPLKVTERLEHTIDYWHNWAQRSDAKYPYQEAVTRSLLVLRALTHEDTGGIVAAATTSLPERYGGERNWDYRYCWLRDAALTLEALLSHGYSDVAGHWRNWLLRAVAGDPEDLQIMYGLAGERDLPERELEHLNGYAGSRPVRVGNAAVDQYQADVLGEVMVSLEMARHANVVEDAFSWPLQRTLLGHLAKNWKEPDNGIWEVRGERQHFTHSRAMLWAAFDRGVRAVEEYGLSGDAESWRNLRDSIADEIEANGFDRRRNTYTQYYGSTTVDASLLQLAQIGYLAYDDPRMLGTVAALERDLMPDGLLLRYDTDEGVDGLPPGEHPFLACSFWLVEQYAKSGRLPDARRLMDRLLGLRNELGLLSEEYDVRNERMLGNYPQAFSHLTLVRAADAIHQASEEAADQDVSRPRQDADWIDPGSN
ncbi:glycoside hydrolase family 15 protein [Saxibacter everestensis]|uniref:Glycoside hydrolase family 15 protein n=1 Tax=Saxibacter everestensis TaxID=2909229 RepID=A0ABY8QZU5_9MICO|nr:glycoside hydrolase family 15 protein [Brevibacteriaceae bacterium ZFBP1038]